MDITNLDGASGQEEAGWMNAPNLIEECTEALVEMDSGPKGSSLFDIHMYEFGENYRGCACCVIEVLRRRGLLTTQALEILERDGAKPLPR